MLILSFFQWWYGPGWIAQIRAIVKRAHSIADMFSIDILVRTLFAPWKQIVASSHADQAAGIRFRAGVDNLISRFVGTSIRSLFLVMALLFIAVSTVASVLVALLWPLLPSLVLFVIPLGFAL